MLGSGGGAVLPRRLSCSIIGWSAVPGRLDLALPLVNAVGSGRSAGSCRMSASSAPGPLLPHGERCCPCLLLSAFLVVNAIQRDMSGLLSYEIYQHNNSTDSVDHDEYWWHSYDCTYDQPRQKLQLRELRLGPARRAVSARQLRVGGLKSELEQKCAAHWHRVNTYGLQLHQYTDTEYDKWSVTTAFWVRGLRYCTVLMYLL